VQAESAAYKPLILPDASAVAVVIGQSNTLCTQSRQALTHSDTQLEEAQAFAVSLCGTVEFFYRKHPDACRRQKAIGWGVVYLYERGEMPDPAPPPNP
jgi:hypothetical protein